MYTNSRYYATPENYAQVLSTLDYIFARDVHHNVSLLHLSGRWSDHTWSDGNADDAYDSFIEWQAEQGKAQLEYEIKKKFKEDLTLEFVGRSGATLQPCEYIGRDGTGEWQPFDEDAAGLSELQGAAQMARGRKLIKVLEYLNARAEELIRELPALWEQFIEDNDPIYQLPAP